MCGIFGFIGERNFEIKKATDVISHRGPDSEGFAFFELGENGKFHESSITDSHQFAVSLGFRRLSIIDLSHSSDQPFTLKEHECTIVFNGEIYNYIELREELKKHGHHFKTNSDTEVLLRSYIEWGEECLNKFNGMWAFAILDLKKNKLFCARDRFGVKPFYYFDKGNTFCFGSEIKQLFATGFEKKINENVIRDFLDKSITDHTEETFFKDIRQLAPGCSLTIYLNKNNFQVHLKQFWELKEDENFNSLSYSDAEDKFRELLTDSIKLRFRSDVPLGSCLSGGLDSSSIVSIAAKFIRPHLNTFSATYPYKEFDETPYIKTLNEMYKEIQIHYCGLTEEIFLTDFEKVIWHQDEPFPTLGIMSQWEVMKLARKWKITTLLDGQGGDELLGGYRKYYAFYLRDLLKAKKTGKFTLETTRLLFNREFNFLNKEGFKRYLFNQKRPQYLSKRGQELDSIASIGLSSAKSLKEKSLQDIKYYSYPPLLRYEDRNSMAFSIEARVPFMDYRLVSFLHSIPSDFIIRNGFTKAILRDSLKNILPKKIRMRKSKLGFSTPQTEWMKDSLNGHFKNYFNTMTNPYLNNSMIKNEFSNYPKSTLHSWDFSRFYIFDKWYQTHFA